MTKMSDAEFEQLLRSINYQSDPTEKTHLNATEQVLRRRIANLFEKSPPTEELPALE